MRPSVRYSLCLGAGLLIGVGAAVHAVRSGAMGATVAIGPWTSGTDLGSAAAGAKTRAVVAMHGLLALPASEARYYNAAVDDAGKPLDGRCTYRLTGGALPARWWSLTLYDADGYLAGPGPYSIESAGFAPGERNGWTVHVAPTRMEGHWLPTAGLARFELTLRAYLPVDGGRGDPPRAIMPSIRRERCA